jgi:hypothetical protein
MICVINIMWSRGQLHQFVIKVTALLTALKIYGLNSNSLI